MPLVTLELDDVAAAVDEAIERRLAPFRLREAQLRQTVEDLIAARNPEREALLLEQMCREAVAKIPPARDGVDGKDGTDGKDGRDGVDGKDGAAGAPGEPGRDGSAGLDGKDGLDGVDGKDGAAGLDGKDGAAGAAGLDGVAGKDVDLAVIEELVGVHVQRAVEAMPAPKDGSTPTEEDIAPLVAKAVAMAVAAIPAAKDGIGVADALLDREGRLVLTLSDGTVRTLGVVVGKDVDPAAVMEKIAAEVANIPHPRDGRDGLPFTAAEVLHDGERGYTLRLTGGEATKDVAFTIPSFIDRGVWREGKYAKGDGVTWEGSFFIAQCDTEARPLVSKDWRQAVKAGRPGKNTETVKYLPATVKRDDTGKDKT